ncbi:cytochrome c oxidase subunit 3 [Pseudomonas chlororaphis]|uniref:Cytochrome-c oxidase n=1 Tax=Pseudomonas chlororaphis TaxID=587753 RepID=A0A1Q8ENU8_9PSED|nr:cytochrome c oxidase subunit 3 [Pseudomonas chlororaphis]OLF53472.1 cytochrome-c oxidase [Pseudomonas chlororaphis]
MCTSAEPVAAPGRRLPGDLAMWLFILAELSVFALLILAFAVTQQLKPQLFAASRQWLDTSTGLAMTLSLLGTGLLAALALERVRRARPRSAATLLLAALLVAGVYLRLKLGEYRHLLELGLDLAHDTFFTLYWVLTGFHFLHVLLGLLMLGWLAHGCLRGRYGAGRQAGFESAVLYWHMVDLVWVLLFPLVYVLD